MASTPLSPSTNRERISQERIHIDDGFIEDFTRSEYVTDWYAFTQTNAGSETLSPVPYVEPAQPSRWAFTPEGMPFTLLMYSDISKSSHFRLGDREMAEGRFAEKLSECNVSAEFAKLNNLHVGDIIEISIPPQYDPQNLSLEIIGIYKDSTNDIINELELVTVKYEDIKISGHITVKDAATAASIDNTARNQILTAAPSAQDLKEIKAFDTPFGLGDGYGVVVCYTRDDRDIFAYIESMSGELPDQYRIIDSADTARFLRTVLDNTAASFTWLLNGVGLISIILCTLIILATLKDRVYDIGVLRVCGLSRIKTAGFVTVEIFMVFAAAFLAACAVYYAAFPSLAQWVYGAQLLFADNDMVLRSTIDWLVIERVKTEYTFAADALNSALIPGFAAVAVFTGLAGFAVSIFIARHEPMKTMTEI